MALLSPQQTGAGRTGGPLYSGFIAPTLFSVDPRAGQVLATTDPSQADPRAGQILDTITPAYANPRAGTIIS